jgi:hypothetical protein
MPKAAIFDQDALLDSVDLHGHTRGEPVRIPALERDFALDVFNRLHVMEMEACVRGSDGRPQAGRNLQDGQDHAFAARYVDEGLHRR